MASVIISQGASNPTTKMGYFQIELRYTAGNGKIKIDGISGHNTNPYGSYDYYIRSSSPGLIWVTVKIGGTEVARLQPNLYINPYNYCINFPAGWADWSVTGTAEKDGLSGNTAVEIGIGTSLTNQDYSDYTRSVFRTTIDAGSSIKYGSYDVNPVIDGTEYASGLSGFTFDVYKAGTLVKDNVTDAAESGIVEGTAIRVVANNTTGYSLSNGDQSKNIVGNGTIYFAPAWNKNTYYVYYNQGTASSTANLPGTQSGLYMNSIALASNNMIKNTDIIETYTTTFNYNGNGQANSSLTSNKKTDYTANGWTTTTGSTTMTHSNGQAYTMPANNLTLYPCFSQVTYNTSIVLPTPTRPDYVFDGWYTSASGGTKIGNGGDHYAPFANNTFYARWIPEKYIGVSSNGGAIKTHNMYISENGKPFTLVLKSKCKVFVNGTQKL